MSSGRFSIAENCRIVTAADYVSAATDRDGATIDMQGYNSIIFINKIAAVAASGNGTIHLASGAQSDMSDVAHLTGTSVAVADDDDNEIKYIELHNPTERYVRIEYDKQGTNAMAESCIAILFNGTHSQPVTQPTGTEGEIHVTPAEGTP